MSGKKKIKPPGRERKKKRYYERYLSFTAEGGKWHSGGIWESSKWKSQGSAFDAYKILEEKTAFPFNAFQRYVCVTHS